MRSGMLVSLLTLLAVAGLALAEPLPAVERTGVIDPAAAATQTAPKPPPDAVGPVLVPPRSPYWPNPLGKLECLNAGCPPPAGNGCPAEDYHDRGELFWASADYLLWWVKKGPLPTPIVTTGSPTSFGILGASDTSVLLGGSRLDYEAFSGARFAAGFWFDRGCNLGLEGSGFFLEKRPADFATASANTGSPLLARPVINALTGQETVELISDPGVVTGNVAVSSHSSLYGWDVNVVDNLSHRGCTQIMLLAGFRYVHLDEDLDVNQNSTLLPGGISGFAGSTVVIPASLTLVDHFDTVNDFYGGQLGVRFEYGGDRFCVSVLGKIALGESHEVVNIAGGTTRVTTSGVKTTVPGGLLALSSNSGRASRDEFAAVPEIGANLGYWITPLIRAYVGYSFLYWSDVARPGDQVSRTINPSLLPTSQSFGTATLPIVPAASFQRTDFWAQGVNFGLEFRY